MDNQANMDPDAEDLCSINNFDTTLIPVEILPCNVTRDRQMDNMSMVELGKQLLECAKIGETELVRDLMCRGAPFTTDWIGTSALHHAAQNNHLETAEVLLRAGISRDARTKVDRTPLHLAAYEGHDLMAQLLLNYGAEVDCKDMLKMTPLHWAVQQKHPEVMQVLMDNGANPLAMSKFSKTPITIALELERFDFIEVLQQEREIISIAQEQFESTDIDRETHDVIQLQAIKDNEDDEDELLEELQDKRKARLQTANANKKQRMMYHRVVHPLVQSTYEEADSDRDELQKLEENTIYLENTRPKQEFANLTEIEHPNIQQFLKENGLTMIPIDNDATIVENAMESGHHVVLTEAGKLALGLTNTKPVNVSPTTKLKGNIKKARSKNVIAINTNEVLAPESPPQNTSRGPNILKRSSNNNNEVKHGKKIIFTPITIKTSPTLDVDTKSTVTSPPSAKNKHNEVQNLNITHNTEPVIIQLNNEVNDVFEISSEEEQITDVDELKRQLLEARKQIEDYRRKLKNKEDEIENYKKQLQILHNQKS